MVSVRNVGKALTDLLTLSGRIEAEVKDVRADVKVLTGKVDNLGALLQAANKRIDDLDDKLNTRIDDLDKRLNAQMQGLDERLSTQIQGLRQSFGQVKDIEVLKAEVREIKAKMKS